MKIAVAADGGKVLKDKIADYFGRFSMYTFLAE